MRVFHTDLSSVGFILKGTFCSKVGHELGELLADICRSCMANFEDCLKNGQPIQLHAAHSNFALSLACGLL